MWNSVAREVLFDTQLQHVKPSDKQEEDKRYDTKTLDFEI